jgi:hypothetical protein
MQRTIATASPGADQEFCKAPVVLPTVLAQPVNRGTGFLAIDALGLQLAREFLA